jgi:hypothetical protein
LSDPHDSAILLLFNHLGQFGHDGCFISEAFGAAWSIDRSDRLGRNLGSGRGGLCPHLLLQAGRMMARPSVDMIANMVGFIGTAGGAVIR